MDQATPTTTMDKKPAARPLQQNSKQLHAQDHKEVVKRGNGGGRRQQREWEREYAGWNSSNGGGKSKPGYGVGGAGGRAPYRATRNREKEGGQVGDHDWSHEDVDEEDLYYGDHHQQQPQRGGGARYSCNITHTLQSWWGGGSNRRGGGARGRRKQYHAGGGALTKMRNNKERFLQARCQFVVNHSMEAEELASAKMPVGYTPDSASPSTVAPGIAGAPSAPACGTPQLPGTGPSSADVKDGEDESGYDPDALVSWCAVEEVVLHMTQETHCPVCLYSPVAPQVTRCGHIYCYPCILHYLALSDKKWRSCPICYEMVVKEDLKSVVCVVHQDYGVGSSIEMSLMRRARHSMLPVPVTGARVTVTTARKTWATRSKVLSILERERSALSMQMASEGEEPEACFIEQALTLLLEREERLDKQYPDTCGHDVTACSADTDATSATVISQNSVGAEVLELGCGGERVPSADAAKSAAKLGEGSGVGDTITNNTSTSSASVKEPGSRGSKFRSNKKENSKRVGCDTNYLGNSASFSGKTGRAGNSSRRSLSFPSINDTSSAVVPPVIEFGSCGYRDQLATADDRTDESRSVSSSSVASDVVHMEAYLDDSDDDQVAPALHKDDLDAGSPPLETVFESLHFDFEEEMQKNNSSSVGASDATTVESSETTDVGDTCETTSAITTTTSPPSGKVTASVGGRHNNSTHSSLNRNNNNAPKSTYYFYQASDGSHVYLHSLNLAMLTSEYGCVESCPPTITATILEKEYHVVDESVRERAKFLRHLPLCCPFETVELQLQPPLVSQHIATNFQASLHRRQQQRALRAKEEQRIEQRIQAQQDKELSSHLYRKVYSATSTALPNPSAAYAGYCYGGGTAVLTAAADDEAFPGMPASEFSSSTTATSSSTERCSVSSDGTSSPELATSPPQYDDYKQQQQPSFAKMVRVQGNTSRASNNIIDKIASSTSGGVGPSVWPTLGRPTPAAASHSASATVAARGSKASSWPHAAAATTQAAAAIGVWGTSSCPQVPNYSRSIDSKSTAAADEESSEDGHFNAPDYRATFSMGFDAALQHSLNAAAAAAGDNGCTGKKGKKGKKKKQKTVLLF